MLESDIIRRMDTWFVVNGLSKVKGRPRRDDDVEAWADTTPKVDWTRDKYGRSASLIKTTVEFFQENF